MKIASWNVNSIAARLPNVIDWLSTAQPDVLCLQEIKCTADKFPADAFAEIGYRSVAHGQPSYNGVAILSRTEPIDVGRGMPDDEDGEQARVLAATIEGIRIVNVYVPNGQEVGTDKYIFKLKWMERLRSFFDLGYAQSDQVLLCGDFNVAPEDRDVHDPAKWQGQILFSRLEKAALQKIKAWGFTDAFRIHNQEGGYYSWWDYRAGAFPRNNGLRIDHIWVSESLAARSVNCWIDKAPRNWERPSDHTPVVAEFL
jgi:exodeoxyribonuclease-3